MIATQLLLVLLLVVANGFFVAAEFALVKVRVSQIELLADEGRWTARLAQKILERLDAYLSACQLGITLASLGLGWVGEPMIAKLLYPLLPEASAHVIGVAIAFAIITFLHITIGEQAPKIMAIQKARPTTLICAAPLILFYQILRPAIWALNGASNLMLRAVGIGGASEHEQVHSEEELRLILAESSAGGSLTISEHSIMENVLNLEDKIARQVMVPRNDIAFLENDGSLEDSYRMIVASGHTRFPLCEGGLEHVAGMIHGKRVLRAVVNEEQIGSLSDLAQDIRFFPETVKLDALLKHFLRDRRHLAMLVDEYGAVSGMVTFEDVLEQLVGPIQDEFDREPPPVKTLSSGKYSIDGRCPLDQLVEKTGVVLPASTADTAGGLVTELLGRIPKIDETIDLPAGQIKVTQADELRVLSLELTTAAAPSADS